MSIRSEWLKLVEKLRRHAKNGGTFVSLSREVGVSRPTVYNWMSEMPETVEKAARMMEVLDEHEKRRKRREYTAKEKAKRKEASSKMLGMSARRKALREVCPGTCQDERTDIPEDRDVWPPSAAGEA